jgi:flagellin-specific chaperone FliS
MKFNINLEFDTDNQKDLEKIEEVLELLRQLKSLVEELKDD